PEVPAVAEALSDGMSVEVVSARGRAALRLLEERRGDLLLRIGQVDRRDRIPVRVLDDGVAVDVRGVRFLEADQSRRDRGQEAEAVGLILATVEAVRPAGVGEAGQH